jgi:hypothetical protein
VESGGIAVKKTLILGLFAAVFFAVAWSCNRLIFISPHPAPTSTLTPTATQTSTVTLTPVCSFTPVTVPTPVLAPSGPATVLYVIRTLADWQNYYGSTSAPAPPATLGSQMILINLQSVPVTQYILPYLPYTGTCNGTTYVYESDTNYPTPDPQYNYTVSVQNVCWTSTQMTVSYYQYLSYCPPGGGPPPIIPIGTITPQPTSTPIPTPTPAPAGSPCNPGQTSVIYIYDAVGVVVPASSLPVNWNQVGTDLNPGVICVMIAGRVITSIPH